VASKEGGIKQYAVRLVSPKRRSALLVGALAVWGLYLLPGVLAKRRPLGDDTPRLTGAVDDADSYAYGEPAKPTGWAGVVAGLGTVVHAWLGFWGNVWDAVTGR